LATGHTTNEETHAELVGEQAAQGISSKPPSTERLVALDTFRGFIMFWIIGGDALLTTLQSLGRNPIIDLLVYEVHHTPWKGLRFYDCIWPSFMLMVGVSIPFSFAKRSRTETDREIKLHALKRALLLFLLGSVRESVFLGSPFLIELSSALQPIAIAYLVVALLVRKPPRVQATIAGLILAGYALLLALVPAPGIPAGTYELNHNLVNAVDVHFLGPHWAVWPYAHSGWGTILSTIPTISTTLLGLIVGGLLRSNRSKSSKAKMIGGLAALCLVLGYAISPVVPIVMKMWTTSYGLASAGWACLMFLLFYWFVDIRGHRKWTLPFIVIGMNAIFIYMATSILPIEQLVGIFTKGLAGHMGVVGPSFSALTVLVVEWLLLFWMYKRKIFVKV
jgi:predicted acyltransferase